MKIEYKKIAHASYSNSYETLFEGKYNDLIITKSVRVQRNHIGLPTGKSNEKFRINNSGKWMTENELKQKLNIDN